MGRNNGHQFIDLFRHYVEDWTPASEIDHARVLFAPALYDAEATLCCSLVLSDRELARADAFLDRAHKDHFIQRRAFRRYCAAMAFESLDAADIDFEETDSGRPFVRESFGISFSFAACRSGFLGAWSIERSVGVDIEDRIDGLEFTELAGHFFTESEATIVSAAAGSDRAKTFLRLWCLKESALKSIGEGLPFGLDAFGFDLEPYPNTKRAPSEYGGPRNFTADLIERNNLCAALVTHAK